MSGETILIEQLRADVERLELDLAAVAMCDSSDCGLCVSCLVSRAEKAERERDARPDISAEDAALHTGAVTFAESVGASQRIHAALRAHAAKVKP